MNKICIDTSSLLFLVRDLLPLDKDEQLFCFIKSKFESEEFILLNSVLKEVQQLSKGIIVEKLPFLKKIKAIKNLDIIYEKEHKIIDNNYAIQTQKEKVIDSYISLKVDFINSADC